MPGKTPVCRKYAPLFTSHVRSVMDHCIIWLLVGTGAQFWELQADQASHLDDRSKPHYQLPTHCVRLRPVPSDFISQICRAQCILLQRLPVRCLVLCENHSEIPLQIVFQVLCASFSGSHLNITYESIKFGGTTTLNEPQNHSYQQQKKS
jgi:hypothetical protein